MGCCCDPDLALNLTIVALIYIIFFELNHRPQGVGNCYFVSILVVGVQ